MRYIAPYDLIRRNFQDIGVTDDQMLPIIQNLLRAVPVDEDWYLTRYPDVAAGIKVGHSKSAKHHFVSNGYFEGRLPFEHELDEEWYLATYPDVARNHELGAQSARDHYLLHGYTEGRLPGDV